MVDKLKAAGFESEQAEVKLIPNQTVKVEDKDTAQKIMDFIDALDEDMDVNNISSNFDISDELMREISL